MAGDGKVPIDQGVNAAYRFMASSIRVVFPAALFVSVFSTAGKVMIEPALSSNQGLGWLLFALSLIGNIAFSAFVLRLAIHEDASGFFGLKLGADEARLIGVSLVLTLIFALVMIVFLILGLFVFAMLAAKSGADFSHMENNPAAAEALARTVLASGGGFLFLVMFVAAIVLLMWLSMRFSMVLPATIGERRMMALSTFAWTKGNSLRILGAVALVVFPLAFGLMFAAMAVGQVIAVASGAPDALSQPTSAGLMAYVVYQFLFTLGVTAILQPAQLGLYAFLYKGLRPPNLPPPAA